jgi:hypothetical protein
MACALNIKRVPRVQEGKTENGPELQPSVNEGEVTARFSAQRTGTLSQRTRLYVMTAYWALTLLAWGPLGPFSTS